MNIADKIQNQFKLYPDLRVLFFFDPQKEHLLEVESLKIPGVEIIKAEQSHFDLKVRLESELQDTKSLLYFPFDPPTEKAKYGFLLFDILKANKVLHLDDVADFMDEYQLLPHQRALVGRYIQDLKRKKHQQVLTKILNPHDFKEDLIVRGLISSYLELPTITDSSICTAKLLTLTLPDNATKLKTFLKKMEYEEVQSTLLRWLYDFLEISGSNITEELLQTAVRKLKYNALTQHLDEVHGADSYGLLKIRDHGVLRRMSGLLVEWSNDQKLVGSLKEVFAVTGAEIREKEIVNAYGADSGYTFFTDTLKYLILAQAIKDTENQPKKVAEILQAVSAAEADGEEIGNLVHFLEAGAELFNKLNTYSGYKLDSPEQYIQRYVDDYMQVDRYYREALNTWEALQKLTLPEYIHLEDLLESIHTRYEKHLIELNREWIACLEGTDFKFSKIQVHKQSDFIKDYISESDQKTAVVISDALRYEAADELLRVLLADTKGDAQLEYVLAGLPSVTSWGMAALLSHEVSEFDGNGLSIQGVSTEGTENRQKILQQIDETAVAVTYKTLANISDRTEIRETYFNQRGIVYVYHDVIDSTGDDRKTELKTFKAVQEAIEDLASLVKKIHSSYNVSRVIVTSDHGFLFNYRKLSDATLQDMPKGDHVKKHSRYLITSDIKDCKDSYVLNLSDCTSVSSDLKVVIPKGINRYRIQGAGYHFVHGGASLQEVVVPVLESTRKRKDISQKVTFKLLNKEFKVVSGAIKIRIYQEEPLGNQVKARLVVAGLFDGTGKLVSNEVTHHLDSGSDLPTQREREFILNLSSGGSQESVLTLKIFDNEDRLNPLATHKVINNTLIESDF